MPSPETTLPNLRVFMVEDEALVALNLEDMLLDLGCTLVASAMHIEAALDIIAQGLSVDVAILDVNLGGQPVFPVAEKLAEAGVTIVFATGYGRGGLPEEWRDRQVLQKPYTQDEVAACLQAAVAAPAETAGTGSGISA